MRMPIRSLKILAVALIALALSALVYRLGARALWSDVLSVLLSLFSIGCALYALFGSRTS
jgi:hypothetical protein